MVAFVWWCLGLLMLTGQDLSKPLNMNQVKKGSLERVLCFDRWDLAATTINTWDVLAPNYLQPEYYTLRGGSQEIHWSHVVRFYGLKLPKRQRHILRVGVTLSYVNVSLTSGR